MPYKLLHTYIYTYIHMYIYIYIDIHIHIHRYTYMSTCDAVHTFAYVYIHIQPIADRVAQHLEIISNNPQFSTRRSRMLMGFIISYLVLIVNPMGRILLRRKSFTNNLEILCHPICNWLYIDIHTHVYINIHRNTYP